MQLVKGGYSFFSDTLFCKLNSDLLQKSYFTVSYVAVLLEAAFSLGLRKVPYLK